MSAESPRHVRAGGPVTVAPQPPSDRTLIDTVSGFISDVRVTPDARDTVLWARLHTADVNEPMSEERDADVTPLLLSLGYGSGVQVWLVPPTGEAQEVMSWRQGTVRVLRILPTPPSGDSFMTKRPLLAMCDSVGPGPQYCSLSFLSIRGGEQVKSIKFKNPILDVLANKRSVVVSFSERFAVFDASTLEDRLAVTTCYPCPCPLGSSAAINPLALGDRWLAYADKKLNPTKRSSGGCEGEGVSSYTATVLHAAKSLSKGLRGLGESVASGLAGGRALSQSPSPPNTEHHHPGVVTILDIEGPSEEDVTDGEQCDSLVAHFVAHSDAIISLKFDSSGMLLVTADKRGHDFHVFRLHPHPCGAALASVHHLYVLHRGDTTAKVQDMCISLDSRWAAVSTLRGTTHVFAISPYGGPCGVRTHTQPRVVNRLSRFQRSAGLPIQAATTRSSSPVGDGLAQGAWFPNPRLPPYPLPTVNQPLAQLRPSTTAPNIPTHTITRNSSGRQRLSSQSEDGGGVPLLACAQWGPAPPAAASPPPRATAAQALYLMTATGHLLQYILHPRPSSSVAKEKVCDDTPVELRVELVAQWPLTRQADTSTHIPANSQLLGRPAAKQSCSDAEVSEEERWLAQVEMVTHAGPHRRLWMGPQFVFKTYNSTLCGSSSSLLEAEAVEVEVSGAGVARSPPVNIAGGRPLVPVLIDSGSTSSLEHSPSDSFRRKSYMMEAGGKPIGDRSLGDVQLKEDLAEAMRETEHGRSACEAGGSRRCAGVARAVDPLGTVVEPAETEPPACDDPDTYTTPNTDETLFRPVVSAPTTLSSHPDISTSSLPASTCIPVENLMQPDPVTPEDDSTPLKSDVVIPAALTYNVTLEHDDDDIMKLDYCKDENVPDLDHCQKQYDSTSTTTEVTTKDKTDIKISENHNKEILHSENCIAENHKQEFSEVMNLHVESIAIKHKSTKRDLRIALNKDVSECIIPDENNEMLQNLLQENKMPPEQGVEAIKTEPIPVKCDNFDICTKFEKIFSKSGKTKVKSKNRCSIKPQDDGNNEKSVDFDPTQPSVSKEKETNREEYGCELQTVIKKSSKKFSEYLDNPKQNLENKENDESDCVQVNIRPPSSKNVSNVTKEAVPEEFYDNISDCNLGTEINMRDFTPVSGAYISDHNSVTESGMKVNTVNSEDQIWSMLNDGPKEIVSSIMEEPTKIQEEKSKSKKSKKSKKFADIEESRANQKQKYESKTKSDNLSFEILVKEKGNFVAKEKYGMCINDGIGKQIQDADDKPTFSDEINVGFIDNDSELCASTVNIIDSPPKKENEIRENSFETFDLPMNFDAYLTGKSKAKENTTYEKIPDEKKDVLQELFGNSAFKLQSSKSRKHSRKDRSKNEDFVNVDKNTDAQKYAPAILNVDTKTHLAPQNSIGTESDAVGGSPMEDFPAIGSFHRSHKKRCITPSSNLPLVKSYSSVTAVMKPEHEEYFGMELSDILDPPLPCRTAIHEKLAEICKRTDIAVAECDSPDPCESSIESNMLSMDFSLDEFKINVMRDGLFDTHDETHHSIDADIDALRAYQTEIKKIFKEEVHVFKNKTSSAIKTDENKTVEEGAEKIWEDDNASPVTSQTDSDKDDKKITTVDPAQNMQRNNKKKPRNKRKK